MILNTPILLSDVASITITRDPETVKIERQRRETTDTKAEDNCREYLLSAILTILLSASYGYEIMPQRKYYTRTRSSFSFISTEN